MAHEDKAALHESGMAFHIHALIGGQMERDARQKLYLLYPEGNWVDTGRLTPYHVIGSVGYGKPLLDRTLTVEDSMRHAFKVACLSFDSTRTSAADVDFPIDVVLYRRNSFPDHLAPFPEAGPGTAGTRLHRIVRITVRHRTSYSFDAPVYLEPHVIRLRPRADGSTRIVDFALEIDPEPVVRADNLDPEGNVITRAWFEGQWSQLILRTRAVVDTLLDNPFRFLVSQPARPLPYAYPPDFSERLALYRRPPDAAHPAVREMAIAAATESQRDPARFASGYAYTDKPDATDLHAWGEVFLPGGWLARLRPQPGTRRG